MSSLHRAFLDLFAVATFQHHPSPGGMTAERFTRKAAEPAAKAGVDALRLTCAEYSVCNTMVRQADDGWRIAARRIISSDG